MPKRIAGNKLTQDNWDQEDEEPEEPGHYDTAPDTQLVGRKMIKARRKAHVSAPKSTSGGGGLFAGFSGFGASSKPTSPPDSTSFPPLTTSTPLFGGFLDKPSTITKDNNSKEIVEVKHTFNAAGDTKQQPVQLQHELKKSQNEISAKEKDDTTEKHDLTNPEFCRHLKALNMGVLSWTSEHMKKNPLIDLTPIFDDYKKHLADLDKKFTKPSTNGQQTKSVSDDTNAAKRSKNTDTVLFSSDEWKKSSETPENTKPFSFGITSTSTPTLEDSGEVKTTVTAAPLVFPLIGGTTGKEQKNTGFSFGFGADAASNKPITDSPLTAFTFGKTNKPEDEGKSGLSSATSNVISPGFTFGATAPTTLTTANTDEDAPYVPPKAEAVEIEEPDAFYSIRCKLFTLKDSNYADSGLGTLYLKPVQEGERTQLLVRTATTLGTVLLNMLLSEQLPLERKGKNNVSICCPPDVGSTEPKMMLIRVKTAEDADKLYEELKMASGRKQ